MSIASGLVDWYWVIGDTNPTTQLYSSATNGMVANNAAAYSTWLTAGNSGFSLVITAMADNGSGKVRLTVGSTANIQTNQRWWFEGLDGSPLANGLQQITVISATTLDITAISFVAGTLGATPQLRGAAIIAAATATADLRGVINRAAVEDYSVASSTLSAMTTNITLTHPLQTVTVATPTGATRDLILPSMLGPEFPLGGELYIRNASTTQTLRVLSSTGGLIATIIVKEVVICILVDKTTAGGSWELVTITSLAESGNFSDALGTILPVQLNTSALGYSEGMKNGTFVVSASASALTIALKTFAGTNPSAGNPVRIPFRNVTGTTGDYDPIDVTAANSLVISSGSTLGVTSSTAFRIWIVGFNDGGTFRLGAINCSTSTQIFPLVEGIASSTAEGGAGAADSAGVIYTGSAVSSKAMRILGYAEWSTSGLTAGTWTTTNLIVVQLFGPGIYKPGEVVQRIYMSTTTQTTTASDTFVATAASQAITLKSAANLVLATSSGTAYCDTTGAGAIVQIRRGTSTAIGTVGESFSGAGSSLASVLLRALDFPNTLSATTYAVYLAANAGTPNVYYPLTGNNRNVDMEVLELMG